MLVAALADLETFDLAEPPAPCSACFIRSRSGIVIFSPPKIRKVLSAADIRKGYKELWQLQDRIHWIASSVRVGRQAFVDAGWQKIPCFGGDYSPMRLSITKSLCSAKKVNLQ